MIHAKASVRSMTRNRSVSHLSNVFTAGREPDLQPGLLRVLQQAAGIRFAFFLAGLALFAVIRPSGRNWGTLGFILVESALLLAYVLSPWPRRRLGAWFLPIALAWSVTLPFIERAISLNTAVSAQVWLTGRPIVLDEGDVSLIWLLVPMVLTGWQYGRRWFNVALVVLMVGYAWLGLLVGGDAFLLGGYALMSFSRLALIVLVGFVIMRFVDAQHEERRALEAANRRLAARAATAEQLAESRERNRLARELHDTLAHSLTGLNLELQAVETLLDHDPAAAREQLAEAEGTVRSGIQESRRAILALRATPLQDLGLAEALRQLARKHADRTGVALTCDVVDAGALDSLTEQTIYRVAEAALDNVEQHAAATELTVSLARGDPAGGLVLEIADNGLGFDPRQVPPDRLGLHGMAERAALIGAKLEVKSAPEEGTRVALSLDGSGS
jgi:signal transduction histidine kinase